MRSLEERQKETVKIFGHDVPRWRDCPECKSKLVCELKSFGYEARCIDCQTEKNKKEEKEVSKKGGPTYQKSFKDPVAIYQTSKGMVGVDKKGNVLKPDEMRYDLQNDPHGWKAVGYKVRETDRFGRPNR